MAGKQHALRTLALKLNVSGTIEVLDEQRLYKGSYGFIKLQIYAPETQNTGGPLCTVFCTTVNELGREVIHTRNYRLIYVGTKLIDNQRYLLFETYLPKEFTETATQPNGLKITVNYCDSKVVTDDEGEIQYDENGVPRRVATNLLVSGQYKTTVYPGGWNDDSMELDIDSAEAAQIAENTRAIEEILEYTGNLQGYVNEAAESAEASAESAEEAKNFADSAAASADDAAKSAEEAAQSASDAAASAEAAAESAYNAAVSEGNAAQSAIEAAEAAQTVTDYLGKTTEFVDELPETGDEDKLYFVAGEENNLYTIYIWKDGEWVKLGETNLVLNNTNIYISVLTISGWVENSQTLTLTGLTADDGVCVYPAKGYSSKFVDDYDIEASEVIDDGIVFTCATTPTENIPIIVSVTKQQEIPTATGYYTKPETDALLATKQNVTDDSLETTSKTVVGAINENKAAIDGLREDAIAQDHFKGFANTAEEVQAITADLNDFAYCINTGTIWIYGESGWYDTEEDYPTDATPLATTMPLMDGIAAVGSSSSAARADHIHQSDTSRASASALQTEIEERTAADATLQTAITAEETARTAADTALQTAINTEASARVAADTTLQENITAEETRAQAAEEALKESISNEATARSSADQALEKLISAEASARTTADSELKSAIEAETSAREAAEAEFATSADLSVDHETYIITLTLKSKDGTVLASPTIDLPLESVVVNGSYNDDNQSIILTLQNGNTVSVPVGDLVAGLASQTALNEEVAARKAADTVLEELISSAATDSDLQETISSEASARETKDAALEERIADIEDGTTIVGKAEVAEVLTSAVRTGNTSSTAYTRYYKIGECTAAAAWQEINTRFEFSDPNHVNNNLTMAGVELCVWNGSSSFNIICRLLYGDTSILEKIYLVVPSTWASSITCELYFATTGAYDEAATKILYQTRRNDGNTNTKDWTLTDGTEYVDELPTDGVTSYTLASTTTKITEASTAESADSATSHSVTALSSSTVIDNYYGSGYWGKTYYFAGGQVPTTVPSGISGGHLEVKRAGYSTTLQILWSAVAGNSNRAPVCYTRRCDDTTGSWTDWEEQVEAEGTYPDMSVGNATNADFATEAETTSAISAVALTSNADLNDCVPDTVGQAVVYYATTNAIATTISNIPSAVTTSFKVTAIKLYSSGTDLRCLQELRDNANHYYIRRSTSSTAWTDWAEIILNNSAQTISGSKTFNAIQYFNYALRLRDTSGELGLMVGHGGVYGYLDFYYDGADSYTSNIYESASGTLTINGNNFVQNGAANLRANSTLTSSPSSDDNSTKIATTAWVNDRIDEIGETYTFDEDSFDISDDNEVSLKPATQTTYGGVKIYLDEDGALHIDTEEV